MCKKKSGINYYSEDTSKVPLQSLSRTSFGSDLGGQMHHKASSGIFRRAKELRKTTTEAEQVLWEKLRAGRFQGIKFRRQHPISKFIVDFYCHHYKLVIELDGAVHQEKDQKDRDFGREEELEDLGLRILRFSNDSVIYDMEYVLDEIEKKTKLK